MLKLENIHFRYAGREVLSGFSLEARAGEVLALVGPTGCGKTTVLRLLAGLEIPERGRVLLDGQPAAADGCLIVPPERRRVAMVFQRLALWPHMTVERSLEFVAPRSLAAEERTARAAALLSELGLAALAARRPAELSGGQAALAAVARALAQEPRALLLDEPFGGLDPGLREATRNRVFSLARGRGLACVYVSHLREEVERSADRLAEMAPAGAARQAG